MMETSQKQHQTQEAPFINDLEVTSKNVVIQSARFLTQALTETQQYHDFEESYKNFREDPEAQKTYNTLKQKQEALRMVMMLNALSDEERAELEKLEKQFLQNKAVMRYLAAQETLIQTCQQIGDILTEAAGLDFGAACRVGGCCG